MFFPFTFQRGTAVFTLQYTQFSSLFHIFATVEFEAFRGQNAKFYKFIQDE